MEEKFDGGINGVGLEDSIANHSEDQSEENVEEEDEPVDVHKQERMRHQYYSFLRGHKTDKVFVMPEKEEDEDVNAYFERCYKETGVRPSPIGPIKKIKPNSKCICGSGKKSKKCCSRNG